MSVGRRLRKSKKEEGAVLLMVLMLTIMFTGLAIVALRHTRSEARAAGAYMDAIQATAVAEAAIALAATDLKKNWDSLSPTTKSSYHRRFDELALQSLNDTQYWYKIPFCETDGTTFCKDGDCPVAGKIPDDGFNTVGPTADTPSLGSLHADAEVKFSIPLLAPAAQGFSTSEDDAATYSWYYIEINSSAAYGMDYGLVVDEDANNYMVRGRAEAEARMRVGPLRSLGR